MPLKDITPLTHFINQFAVDFSEAVKTIDNEQRPKYKEWQNGIGAFPEKDIMTMVVKHLKNNHLQKYQSIQLEKPYPGHSGKRCDLFIEDIFACEVKNTALFNSEKQLISEYFSKKLLFPYLSPKSNRSISLYGDALKLASSEFKTDLVIALMYFYPDCLLEKSEFDFQQSLNLFEKIFQMNNQVNIIGKTQSSCSGLKHPVHQNFSFYLWKIEPV